MVTVNLLNVRRLGLYRSVPEGRLKIAQQFIAGHMANESVLSVPEGRLKGAFSLPLNRPYGTFNANLRAIFPALPCRPTVRVGARWRRAGLLSTVPPGRSSQTGENPQILSA